MFTRGTLFVDTSAWVAVAVRRDPHHTAGRGAWEDLVASGRQLATTNAVVGETYTVVRARYGYAAAWSLMDWLEGIRRLARHFVTPEIEREAYSILRRYRDQDFSFVDATSFAFMRRAGIREAFALDRHFATAGFARIPVDRPPE